MDEYLVWLVILLVLGVIISNIMVLKYTTKFKWPGKKTKSSKTEDDSEQDPDTKN